MFKQVNWTGMFMNTYVLYTDVRSLATGESMLTLGHMCSDRVRGAKWGVEGVNSGLKIAPRHIADIPNFE